MFFFMNLYTMCYHMDPVTLLACYHVRTFCFRMVMYQINESIFHLQTMANFFITLNFNSNSTILNYKSTGGFILRTGVTEIPVCEVWDVILGR